MGGLISSVTGAVGSLLGVPSNVLSSLSTLGGSSTQSNIASSLQSLANTEIGTGSQINQTAMEQYQAGASGQLTPAQSAMATNALNQANLGTQGAYSNLGLGNSTMESQDIAGNQLQNLAEQANLEAQSEELGLQGLGMGLNYYNAGGSSLEGAANVTQQQIADILAALQGSGSTGTTGTTAGTGLGTGTSTSSVTPNADILSGATGSSDVAGQQALAGAGLF